MWHNNIILYLYSLTSLTEFEGLIIYCTDVSQSHWSWWQRKTLENRTRLDGRGRQRWSSVVRDVSQRRLLLHRRVRMHGKWNAHSNFFKKRFHDTTLLFNNLLFYVINGTKHINHCAFYRRSISRVFYFIMNNP